MAEIDDSRKRLLLLTTKISSDVSFAVSFIHCIIIFENFLLQYIIFT